jgi:transposase
MRRISEDKKNAIIRALSTGETHRSIAARVGVHHSTVGNIRKGLVNNGISIPKSQNGRPALLTERDRRNIVRSVVTGRQSTAVQLQRTLQTDSLIPNVSVNTLRRVMYKAGLKGRIKRKKPLLKKEHRKKRKAFAQIHSAWTMDDWKKVIWSDESKFNVFGSDGREYCWRRDGEALRDQNIQPTVKHGGGSVSVWGCITWDGVGFLCRIKGNMDGELYRSILAGDLIQTLEWYGLQRDSIVFQHDNDPKHTVTATKRWLDDNQFQVMTWPPQSPDMNPIEHIWNELDRRIRKRPVLPRSADDLWTAIEEEWEGIPQSVCQNLIKTMPERIRDLRKAKGGFTRW